MDQNNSLAGRQFFSPLSLLALRKHSPARNRNPMWHSTLSRTSWSILKFARHTFLCLANTHTSKRKGQKKSREGEREEADHSDISSISLPSRVVEMASRLRQPQSTTDKNAAILRVSFPRHPIPPPPRPVPQRRAHFKTEDSC